MTNWIRLRRFSRLLSLAFASLLLVACASTGEVSGGQALEAAPAVKNPDPIEAFNRGVFEFNSDFDKALGKPIAQGYVRYIPLPVRRGVSNFFSNLWEPSSMINAVLQGKFQVAAGTTARFLINTTAGILGVFDVAAKLGVAEHDEDFGQTLAVWGVADGPYLMLPFLGPSNVRDLGGIAVEWYGTDLVPLLFKDGLVWSVAVRLLDSRASVLGLDETLDLQIDPYLFLREGYRQSRLIEIYDGYPPQVDDPFEDELFGE